MQESWKGIHKLHEEMGELHQVLGKLGAYPTGQHPDGTDWRKKLLEELADTQAVLSYFITTNLTISDSEQIANRANWKFAKFNEWGLTGVRHDERQ